MKKTKLYGIFAILFFLLNVGLIIFIIIGQNTAHHGPIQHKKPRDIIINRLNLDEQQISHYDALIPLHKNSVAEKGGEIRTLKRELYTLLQADDVTKSETLINQINILQKELEVVHFQHFLDIKNLCRNDQLVEFNKLTQDLGKMFSPERPLQHKKK